MNKKTFQEILRAGIILGDAVVVFAAVLLAYYLRFYIKLVPLAFGIPPVTDYLFASPLIIIVFMLAFNYAGLYRIEHGKSRFDELVAVLIASSASIIILMSITFMFRNVSYSRVVIMHLWVLSLVMLGVWRLVYRSIFHSLSKYEVIIQRLIIIGATDVSTILIERLKRTPGSGYKVVGVVDNKAKKGGKFRSIPVLGKISEFSRIAEEYKVDEVFVGISDYNRREIAEIILENEKIKFLIASDVLGIITKSIDYDEMYGIPVFEVRELPLMNRGNRFIKRSFDILFSFFALVAISPVLIITALLVKLTSKGPVFYRQERVTRGNSRFLLYKFRTMKADAEARTGPVWAKENDPRRTPVGAFLRKISLDELPQFFNVFFGQMSMVGPRPERPHFVKKFSESIPRYLERHKVKAGMTGWAAVNGLRGDTSIEERVKYDLYYIENWTLWLDIKICIKTALEVFHHESAY